MRNRLAVSLIVASLVAPSVAFAQSTTAEGAANGARAGGDVAGPIGAMVGGTVGAAVGAGLEIPNAVITSVEAERAPSVVVPRECDLRLVRRHVAIPPFHRAANPTA